MQSQAFVKIYWLCAWLFAVGVGEILAPAILNPSYTLFKEHPVAIAIYYAVVTRLAAEAYRRSAVAGSIVAFIFGAIVEVHLFGGIPHYVAAGVFYVFLFGVPWLVARKVAH